MAASQRKVWVVAASTALVLTAIGVWFVRQTRRTLSEIGHAYMAYSANLRATEAVEKYVREREKWPTSWRELESIPTTLPSGGWEEIRIYVDINFNLTLDDVAKQRVEDFDAIKPVEPVLSDYRQAFAPLLEAVHTVQGASVRNGNADECRQP